MTDLACRSCAAGLPTSGARVCPECGHVFRGHGWDGIDAHWRSNHEDMTTYEAFFASLCTDHRHAKAPLLATSDDDLKNEARTVTRFFAGKTVRAIYRHTHDELILELSDGSRLLVRGDGGLELAIQE